MNQRFALFRRSGVYYCEDRTTHKQTSLRTRDEDEALRLISAKNESARQPALNLQIARVYLSAGDPALSARTWQHVMTEIIATKTGPTRERWTHASKDKAFDSIRDRKLVETNAEHFLYVLKAGFHLNECLPSPRPQFRHWDELAALARASQAQLARSALQRKARHHF